MDYLAHGLWGYIAFNRLKKPFYGVLFAVLPDTFSWVLYFIWRIFNGVEMGRPVLEQIPDWVMFMYGMSHSIIIAALFFGLVYYVVGRIPLYMWGWPLHIAIDVPTHTRAFLPTPFLFPLSDWKFPGFSWGEPWFMILNYVLIVTCLSLIIYKRRKDRRNNSE